MRMICETVAIVQNTPNAPPVMGTYSADPYGEQRTSDTPLLAGEIEYNEKNGLPLREYARRMLGNMGWIGMNLLGGYPAGFPAAGRDNAKQNAYLSAAYETWKAAGRPTGQKWVEVFFEFLLREKDRVPPGICL